jgi:hypothetical protein
LPNLQLFGTNGMRFLLGHLIEMAELLREHLEGHDNIAALLSKQFPTSAFGNRHHRWVFQFPFNGDGVETFPDLRQLTNRTNTVLPADFFFDSGRCNEDPHTRLAEGLQQPTV